jgi:hypothetical protein
MLLHGERDKPFGNGVESEMVKSRVLVLSLALIWLLGSFCLFPRSLVQFLFQMLRVFGSSGP